jgi:hypothetical protein
VRRWKMLKYPSKRLIQETKALIRLQHFLRNEVGLKVKLSAKELKTLLYALKWAKKG